MTAAFLAGLGWTPERIEKARRGARSELTPMEVVIAVLNADRKATA